MKVLVVSVTLYRFAGEGGEVVEGCRVQYLDRRANRSTEKGLGVYSITCPKAMWDEFPVVPGWYELELGQRPGRHGRPQVTVEGVRFLEAAEMA